MVAQRRKDMGYVENNLGRGEKVLARAKHSWAAFWGALLVDFIVVLIVCLAIHFGTTWLPTVLANALGASLENSSSTKEMQTVYDILMICRGISITVVVLSAFLHLIKVIVVISRNQLVVTNKRLLGRSGFIAKQTVDIILLKLDTINCTNGFMGAIFRYGSLKVVSAGSQVSNIVFPYIKNTEEFRRAVLTAIDRAKEEERQAQAEAQANAMKRMQYRW